MHYTAHVLFGLFMNVWWNFSPINPTRIERARGVLFRGKTFVPLTSGPVSRAIRFAYYESCPEFYDGDARGSHRVTSADRERFNLPPGDDRSTRNCLFGCKSSPKPDGIKIAGDLKKKIWKNEKNLAHMLPRSYLFALNIRLFPKIVAIIRPWNNRYCYIMIEKGLK